MPSTKPQRRTWWLAFLDKTNFTVTGLTAAFILYTRSAGVTYFGAGALACSLSVKYVVKRLVRQPRPVHSAQKKSTYGMPSTHSASIGYYASYITLACLFLPVHPSFPESNVLSRMLPPLVVVPWAISIATSRVSLGHHTWEQVIVGCVYGVAFGLVTFKAWTSKFNQYGQMVEGMVDEWLAQR